MIYNIASLQTLNGKLLPTPFFLNLNGIIPRFQSIWVRKPLLNHVLIQLLDNGTI